MCAPGMLQRWDDSQKYLSDHPYLVCEDTANYLVVICIDFEIDEVSDGRKVDLHILVKKRLIQPHFLCTCRNMYSWSTWPTRPSLCSSSWI